MNTCAIGIKTEEEIQPEFPLSVLYRYGTGLQIK
jgi:hypothetical protein